MFKLLSKKLVFLAVMLLLLVPVAVIAQDVVQTQTEQGPTEDYAGVFETFAALVAVIPIVTELFKKFIPNSSSTAKQILSWGIGIVITMFGWTLNLGFLSGLTWYIALLYGLGASLASNGLFDTGLISWIISLFSARKK